VGVLCEISASQAASPKQRRTPTGSGVAQDEVFGPIAPIARFKDIDEVVRFVNARYSWTLNRGPMQPPRGTRRSTRSDGRWRALDEGCEEEG
jgi:hypothetical protein